MKAPLRFAFGWVLYLAIFSALVPLHQALYQYVLAYPLLSSFNALAALAALIAIASFWGVAFYRWMDAPRRVQESQIEKHV